MRRTDRAVLSRSEQDALIFQGTIAHVALVDGNAPYVVPMNFGYDGKVIYLHSAAAGKKLDCIAANPHVALNIVLSPEFMPKTGATKGCDLTMHYDSVVINGIACLITEAEERLHALQTLLKQFSSEHLPVRDAKNMAIIRVDIDTITAKSHR